MNKSRSSSIVKLVATVLLCEGVGGLGTLATRDGLESWYPSLKKPGFNPPDRVFGPVWTVLYLMMGVALYLASSANVDRSLVRAAQRLFAAQMALNVGWTFLFFGRRSPFYAFVEIILLWVAILLTIRAFLRVSKTAGWLMAPYLLWTSFAMVLNFSLWRLNDRSTTS